MKKLLGWMLALALVLSLTAVSAEEAEQLSELTADAGLPAEEYREFTEAGMKMWVPASFKSLDLTAEDREKGYIAYFTSEEGAQAVAVMCIGVGRLTLEDYRAFAEQEGITPRDVTINGLSWLAYPIEQFDAVSYAYTDEASLILEITLAPMSDADFAALAETIIASVQPL